MCLYNLSLHFELGDSTKIFHVELQASVLVIQYMFRVSGSVALSLPSILLIINPRIDPDMFLFATFDGQGTAYTQSLNKSSKKKKQITEFGAVHLHKTLQ